MGTRSRGRQPRGPRPASPSHWLLGCALAACGGNALAQDRCPEALTMDLYPPVVSLRVDNDLFGSQDQGYTSGVGLSLVSPNLKNYTGDPCLPALARWINGHVERIQPEGYDQQNMVLSISQSLYTPNDPRRTDLIQNDRPYAGALLVRLGYNAREDNHLRTTQLALGTVGPAALGKQSQQLIHRITGSEEFLGWDRQLRNEPVVNLIHERSDRLPARALGNGNLQWDAIGHWGGALGNFATYMNTGFELRLGRDLPDDFGSSPVRPAGNNTAPTIDRRVDAGWSWHAFLAADARWVLRDITLDGNTFKNSHSVDREAVVGDAALGFAVIRGRTKFAFARYFRTREFHGQQEHPNYGSFTISRAL